MNDTVRKEIEALIGYEFRDPGKLVTAFTHASFARENAVESNRRFEFLGDAILNFLAARALFFADERADAGELTNRRRSFVSKEPLSKAVNRLGLLRFLRVGKCENTVAFNEKSVSDLYEAIVGAIYYDSGDLLPCELFFHQTVCTATAQSYDSISTFKEWNERNPQADVRSAGQKTDGGFSYTLFISGKVFEGAGRTKKEAEREACRKACEFLHLI